MFNVSDNLKKLMNRKTDSLFIEEPRSKTIQEQSQEFFSKIYSLDLMKENIYRALLAQDQINILLIGPPATSKTLFMEQIQQKCNDVCHFDLPINFKSVKKFAPLVLFYYGDYDVYTLVGNYD